MRASLPRVVTRGLSERQLQEVQRWWRALSERARAELFASWTERNDLQLLGRYVDPLEVEENAEWTDELREYVNGHEVQFFLAERSYHICRAHSRARQVLATGIIPAGFVCPLARGACPLAQAGSQGQAVKLYGTVGMAGKLSSTRLCA